MGLQAALLLLVVKAVIWSVALGSGTSGGVLAPLLIMGGALGAIASHVLPAGPHGYWALLGMAALMGSTMRAPMTATLFAAEVTGNVAALPALLLACASSYGVAVLVMKRSILTEKIARRGRHIVSEFGVDPFDLARVAEVMVTRVDTLPATMEIDACVGFFADPGQHRHKSYPVIGRDGKLLGMISRADILRLRREGEHSHGTLGELLDGRSLLTASPDEIVGRVIDRMVGAEVGRLAVVDRASGDLVGLVSRKDLLHIRRTARASEETRIAYFGQGKETEPEDSEHVQGLA